MLQIEYVEKIKARVLCSETFSFLRKSCRMWEPERPQMTICNRVAYCISKATRAEAHAHTGGNRHTHARSRIHSPPPPPPHPNNAVGFSTATMIRERASVFRHTSCFFFSFSWEGKRPACATASLNLTLSDWFVCNCLHVRDMLLYRRVQLRCSVSSLVFVCGGDYGTNYWGCSPQQMSRCKWNDTRHGNERACQRGLYLADSRGGLLCFVFAVKLGTSDCRNVAFLAKHLSLFGSVACRVALRYLGDIYSAVCLFTSH
jgi:hypothetical protein